VLALATGPHFHPRSVINAILMQTSSNLIAGGACISHVQIECRCDFYESNQPTVVVAGTNSEAAKNRDWRQSRFV
jgi:hypothetical protein